MTVLEAEDTIGGGARSGERPFRACVHDLCSAVHPMAVGSPFLIARARAPWARVALARGRLRPPARRRHGGRDVPLRRGDRGGARARTGPLGGASSALRQRRSSRSPTTSSGRSSTSRGTRCVSSASASRPRSRRRSSRARGRRPQARALFGGIAAHAISPLNRPMSSSVGTALICAGHAFGWAVARGGSGSITNALASALRERGGKIECGVRVRRSTRSPEADAVVFDLAPGAVADIAGDRLPGTCRARVPALPPWPRRLQGRPGGGGRRAVDERGLPAGGHGALRRAARGDRRRRARGQPRRHARRPVRPGRPAIPGGPRALERRRPPGLGLRARAERLHGRRRGGRDRSDRAIRARAARADRRALGPHADRDRPRRTRTTSAATSSPARTRRGRC